MKKDYELNMEEILKDMIGKTMTKVEIRVGKSCAPDYDCDRVMFTASDGTQYEMFHQQDCCESVNLEDIDGDIANLEGSPITMAEFVDGESGDHTGETYLEDHSYTWTFCKFATVKGYVTFRWYGTSNGYYSETPSIFKWIPG